MCTYFFMIMFTLILVPNSRMMICTSIPHMSSWHSFTVFIFIFILNTDESMFHSQWLGTCRTGSCCYAWGSLEFSRLNPGKKIPISIWMLIFHLQTSRIFCQRHHLCTSGLYQKGSLSYSSKWKMSSPLRFLIFSRLCSMVMKLIHKLFFSVQTYFPVQGHLAFK
jgi:hypothetical protein